ncbi:MAG: hypothetical protein Q9227_005796 [Pyrenula ochraceoflavens]
MAPKQWDDTAKLRLLMLVIDKCEAKLSTKNWEEVANAFGGGITASAVSQKFYKLKKECEKLQSTSGGGGGGGGDSSSAPTTPRKRKPKTEPETDEDGDHSPKRKNKKAAPRMKPQGGDENDSGGDGIKVEPEFGDNGNGFDGME